MIESNKLTTKEIKELIPPEIDEINLKSFSKILKYFFLSKETNERVLSNLDPSTRDPKSKAIAEFFGLDAFSQRAWFHFSLGEEDDIGYINYIQHIHNTCLEIDNSYDEKAKRNFILKINTILNANYQSIRDIVSQFTLYENYKKNTILVGKQKRKLFKCLLQCNILSPDDTILLSQTKINNKLYMCISRNPIDFLFCSTDQSFTSCEDTRYALNGLGSLSLDPNRVLMFLTKEKPTNFSIKETFYHFKYIQRSWGLVTNNDSIVIIRYYPTKKAAFEQPLKNIGYHSFVITNRTPPFYSKYTFNLPTFFTENPCFPYLDHLGLELVKSPSEVRYSYPNGSTGNIGPSLAGMDFYKLATDKDSIMYYLNQYLKGDWICEKCKRPHNIFPYTEIRHYADERGTLIYLCTACSSKLVECALCHLLTNKENLYKNIFSVYEIQDIYLCKNCANHIVTCNNCGDTYISRDNIIKNGTCPYCTYQHSQEIQLSL